MPMMRMQGQDASLIAVSEVETAAGQSRAKSIVKSRSSRTPSGEHQASAWPASTVCSQCAEGARPPEAWPSIARG